MREIQFQLDAFMHGWQKTLAARLDVSPATTSRRCDAWDWDAVERDALLAMVSEHAQLAQRLWTALQAMPVQTRMSKVERVSLHVGALRDGAALDKQRREEADSARMRAWPVSFGRGYTSEVSARKAAESDGKTFEEYMDEMELQFTDIVAWNEKYYLPYVRKQEAALRAQGFNPPTRAPRASSDATELFIANPAHWSKLFPETEK